MLAGGDNMAWNAALLGVVLFFLVLAVGVEYVSPFGESSELPAELAPQFGISEDRLREAMLNSLLERRESRMEFAAAPWCVVATLLVVRMRLERRHKNSTMRPAT
jgi:hypothetical protein